MSQRQTSCTRYVQMFLQNLSLLMSARMINQETAEF